MTGSATMSEIRLCIVLHWNYNAKRNKFMQIVMTEHLVRG